MDMWEGLLRVNLIASFHTTRLALGGMRVRDWGRIVNMASVYGLVASAHKAAYCASKFGLVGLTKVSHPATSHLTLLHPSPLTHPAPRDCLVPGGCLGNGWIWDHIQCHLSSIGVHPM